MCFGEPHPSPFKGSPTRMSKPGQQSYKRWSSRRPWALTFGLRDKATFNETEKSCIKNRNLYSR